MRVLMVVRKTLKSSPGGDTVQINSTAKYLRDLGLEVDICLSGESINYIDYQLIHFFNIIRPDDIIPHIKKSVLPYVVSTIYVDYYDYEKNNRKGIFGLITRIFDSDQLEYLKAIARFLINGDKINSYYYIFNGHKKSVKQVLKKARLLLPNSHNEYQRVFKSYKIANDYRKVPNAIDKHFFSDEVNANEEFKNHVLCVGRIEGRKNQLNLIKALVNTEFNLTIIGKPSPNHLAYFEECKRVVSQAGNVRIIEHLDHSELASIYKAAKVHVLPSWFETTGLSSLEAVAMDCNIVVTKKGDTFEYFEDMAYYCEPDNIDSIRSAVKEAFNNPVNIKLKERVLTEYIWERAAQETLEAYKFVLCE